MRTAKLCTNARWPACAPAWPTTPIVDIPAVGSAEKQIDRILLGSAREFGIEAAERYHRLLLAIFAILIAKPHPPEARDLPGAPGVRAYPMRLERRLSDPGHRVGQPRHIVIYRIAADGVVEVLGVAHDRMRLAGAVRRMRREAGR